MAGPGPHGGPVTGDTGGRPALRTPPADRITGALVLLVVVALAGVWRLQPEAPVPAGGAAPPPAVGSAASPVSAPPLVTPTGTGNPVLAVQPDGVTPVRWDPCRELRVVLNPAGAPADAEALVRDALATVSAATGLRLVYEGTTDEPTDWDRPAFQPERYGERWAPVLVTWGRYGVADDVGVAGRAGPDPRQGPDGTQVYVTGQVWLSDDVYGGPGRADAGDRVHRQAVLLHELGHLVGLGHTDRPGDLMFTGNTGQTWLSDDDRAGFALVGGGPCVPGL